MKWTLEETNFLKVHYPNKGKVWCAKQLNRSVHEIRSKTARMKIYQNRDSDFFKDWQKRAATSKIGKKRPDQAIVMKAIHESGKLIKTDQMKKEMSIRSKNWIQKNGHPKGMKGKKHSQEFKDKMSIRVKKEWSKMTDEKRLERNKKIIQTRFARGKYAQPRMSCTWKAGWREFGGKRHFYRSRWEANYARYLELLKIKGQIKDWLHEPEVFWFEGIKRGCVSYLPDFKIINLDESYEYHEVKGWMDERSITKIKRMKKYYPKIKLLIIRQKEYDEIKNKLSKLIQGWE